MAKGDPSTLVDIFKDTGITVPKAQRREALSAAADYIKEQILSRTADGKTSVQGGKWKRSLSPEYKKLKQAETGVGFANMELHGDMLDSFDVKPEGDRIRIEVGSDQVDKAEGNLLGSYGSSPDPAKAREFMPHVRGQKLHKEILAGVADILREYADAEEN